MTVRAYTEHSEVGSEGVKDAFSNTLRMSYVLEWENDWLMIF
jgi:hypothetical protein